MEWIAIAISGVTLAIVVYLLKADRNGYVDLSKQIKDVDDRIKNHENNVGTLATKLSTLIRMLRQHMKDGEILVEIGTANDRKLINALQAAGIYVQFDEFPQTELGRSKVIAEMLHGAENG